MATVKITNISIIDLRERHIKDFLYIDTDTTSVGYRDTTSGTYYYNTATATFETTGTGTLYNFTFEPIKTISADSAADVNANMRTVEMVISPTDELVVDDLYIRTEPLKNTIDVIKHTDGFNNYDTTGIVTFNMYNDPREVNDDTDVVAKVGGTRNSLVHSDIPIATDMVSSVSVELQTKNEANILDLKMIPSDRQTGGDR